jgi:hypothetical protein
VFSDVGTPLTLFSEPLSSAAPSSLDEDVCGRARTQAQRHAVFNEFKRRFGGPGFVFDRAH